MKRLALDTSSLACSVALQVDDAIFERHEETPREHTRLLMPMIRNVLDEAGCNLTSLDAIVLGNGPGSFIGMRIAASVAQGLAHGAGLRIVPVSSLAAVAAQVFAESNASHVAVAQDAHMSEVYLGLFARGPAALPQPLVAERLHAGGVIAELDAASNCVAAGYGWIRYPDYLASNAGRISGAPDVLHPRASFLLALSADSALVEPQDIEPAYLRSKVAARPGESQP